MVRVLVVLLSGYEEKDYYIGWWVEELFVLL